MNIVDAAQTRYSTKAFDDTRKISDNDVESLMALLRLSPSSVNLQPWHFVIAGTDNAKRRLAKGTQDLYSFNEAKVMNASHVVLFCARTGVDHAYLEHLIATEELDGRFADPAIKTLSHNARSLFVNMHRYDLKDLQHWMEKQVYLNMGTLLLGAAALGIDAVPIEGCDTRILDQELNLREQGFTAVAMVALGYRKASDFNAKLPKSRLPETEIFTVLA
ncbi:oxygen-insensitive NAD(P)H nitroreductase [Plesiomonas shigelloides]|uniref:oxygen-insensitive NAD(P)H nitroreductase n=1 Tax=Plesiomonas shigelloides TaxID=703 RepID=UPI0031B7EA31